MAFADDPSVAATDDGRGRGTAVSYPLIIAGGEAEGHYYSDRSEPLLPRAATSDIANVNAVPGSAHSQHGQEEQGNESTAVTPSSAVSSVVVIDVGPCSATVLASSTASMAALNVDDEPIADDGDDRRETWLVPVGRQGLHCGRAHVIRWGKYRRSVQVGAVAAMLVFMLTAVVFEFVSSAMPLKLFLALIPVLSSSFLLSTFHVGVMRQTAKEFEPWYMLMSALVGVAMVLYLFVTSFATYTTSEVALTIIRIWSMVSAAVVIILFDACSLHRWWKTAYMTTLALYLAMHAATAKLAPSTVIAVVRIGGDKEISFHPLEVLAIAFVNFAVFTLKNAFFLLRGHEFALIRFHARRSFSVRDA